MDLVSHGLASFALARTIFPRAARLTLAGALVAGTIADADYLSATCGPSAFLTWHRTFAHSILGAFLIAALVSFTLWIFSRGQPKTDPLRMNFLLALVASLLHVAMDFCQNDSVEILWPFRSQRYSAELLANFDLWILVMLLAGVLLPKLFALVTEEIGAKSKSPRGRTGAVLALAGIALYIGARGVLHDNAVALLESRTYRGELTRKVAAFAESDSPLHWHGIVETERALHDLDLNVGSAASFNPDAAVVSYKPQTSRALEAAGKTDVARRFLQSARFPKATVEKTTTGYRVEIRGFPYLRDAGSGKRVLAVVETDPNGKVLHQEIIWEHSPKEG